MGNTLLPPAVLGRIHRLEFLSWEAKRIAAKLDLPVRAVEREMFHLPLVESVFGYRPLGRCPDCGSTVALPCYGCLLRSGAIYSSPIPAVAHWDDRRELQVRIFGELGGDLLVSWGNPTNKTVRLIGKFPPPKLMQWINPYWIREEHANSRTVK